MSLGKVAVFAAGIVVGGLIGIASAKSEKVDKATTATIKAGLKAKDWVADKCEQTKDGVKKAVASGKKSKQSEETA